MSEIKLTADSGGGSVSFKGPASTTSNAAVPFVLPVADGSAGQYLKTDGSKNLSFATVSAGYTRTAGSWVATSNKFSRHLLKLLKKYGMLYPAIARFVR